MRTFLTPEWISAAVFTLCYVLFVALPSKRAWTACLGAALLPAFGILSWHSALCEKIGWNVIALFLGTLILAELFLKSKVPAVFAEWLVARASSPRAAMLALCALAGGISICVENVAVVLLVAPVALSLAKRLKTNPAPLLIGIAVSSNLQGTATMIGDPPSMILAGELRMGFWDFFAYQGRPGIFFAVQAGAVASLAVLFFVFRKHRGKCADLVRNRILSPVPAALLGLLVLGLSFSSVIDREFRWFAGSYTLLLAACATAWLYFSKKKTSAAAGPDTAKARRARVKRLLRALDWNTAFFLIGVFVLVGGITEAGWLDRTAAWMAALSSGSPAAAFLVLVGFSVLVSGFVDNVPYLLVMIPVADRLAAHLGASVPFLMFGLLIGACLGGNITPIGASANVVTLGILRRRGINVSFRDFMKISVPFTLAALLAGCLFVWAFYG